jgi:hypothetical protein
LPGTPGADGHLTCIVNARDGEQAPRSLLPLTLRPCRSFHSWPYVRLISSAPHGAGIATGSSSSQ